MCPRCERKRRCLQNTFFLSVPVCVFQDLYKVWPYIRPAYTYIHYISLIGFRHTHIMDRSIEFNWPSCKFHHHLHFILTPIYLFYFLCFFPAAYLLNPWYITWPCSNALPNPILVLIQLRGMCGWKAVVLCAIVIYWRHATGMHVLLQWLYGQLAPQVSSESCIQQNTIDLSLLDLYIVVNMNFFVSQVSSCRHMLAYQLVAKPEPNTIC